MKDWQYPDIKDAEVTVLSRQEMALWRRDQGINVVERGGRYWCETFPGFYQAVHWLAEFRADEAKRPTLSCFGYRVVLREEDTPSANATWAICLLPDLRSYDESFLPRKERAALRKSRRNVRIVHLTDAELLSEQGYGVYRSACARIRKKTNLTKERYLAKLDSFVRDRRRLVVAGLVGDQLAGYGQWFAVGDYVYGWNIYVDSRYLNTEATTGIEFEAWQAFRRSGLAGKAVNGMHTPELPGLMAYKRRMGFEVVHLPAKMQMLYPVRAVLKEEALGLLSPDRPSPGRSKHERGVSLIERRRERPES